MPIQFNQERWARVRENNRLWRERKLGRPLIQWKLWGADPGRPRPELPPYHLFWPATFMNHSVDEILDYQDFALSSVKYIGDAFPSFCPNFGPGITAEFLGGHAEPKPGTVWFQPGRFEGLHPGDMRVEYSGHSRWLAHLLEICRKGVERFEGGVQIAMTDLGGAMDILASLRPAEKLLADLYDCPEEVERLVWEIHRAWFQYFDLINAALAGNPGHTSWADVFSDAPAYMLQCDLSYNFSPEMFDRFALPELRASCERLPGGAFYHLDGTGQLPHVKSLHAIPSLAGMQWVSGAPVPGGLPASVAWHDLQRRFRDEGKLSQTWGGPDELEALANAIGDVSHLVIIGGGSVNDEARFRKVLKKFGVED